MRWYPRVNVSEVRADILKYLQKQQQQQQQNVNLYGMQLEYP